MSALPGEHYCKNHQGYLGHYDPKNCTVCRLQGEISRFQAGSGEPVGGDVKTEFNRYKRAVITGAQRDKVDVDTRFSFADFHAGYRAGRWSSNHPTTQPGQQGSVPKGENDFGLDARYFHEKLRLILRDINSYTPTEMARALGRLAVTANPETMREPEFNVGDLINQTKYRDSTPQPEVEQETDTESYKHTLRHTIALIEAECEKCGQDRIGDVVWFETDIDRLKELLEKVHLLAK